MRTSVQLIEDSIYNGVRLTTLELEYPAYIHAEFMTHRVFSRNAQSNRAIPVAKLIQRVYENKWYPIWVKNNPGMQANTLITDVNEIRELNTRWDEAKEDAIANAEIFQYLDVHKQIVNRLLFPFQTMKVIVSATDWNNFFRLRIHPAAQQEIQELAILIKDALISSEPKRLDLTQWHLPYISNSEKDQFDNETLVKLSAARCARVSYLNHNGVRDINEDIYLHSRLKEEKHMSPFEHQATPYPSKIPEGNFRNWRQYRYYIENDLEI